MYPCYLDIDGCIDNPLAWSKIETDGPITVNKYLSLLSAEKIGLLNRLNRIQIIISSSWRITSGFDVATLLKLKA